MQASRGQGLCMGPWPRSATTLCFSMQASSTALEDQIVEAGGAISQRRKVRKATGFATVAGKEVGRVQSPEPLVPYALTQLVIKVSNHIQTGGV